MSFYPEKISSRFHSPKNAGEIKNPSAIGSEANFTCGVSIKFYLEIDDSNKKIQSASFKTNGCGYVVAIADLLCDEISKIALTDLEGMDKLEVACKHEFGEISADRMHCVNLCFDALSNALSEYRLARVAEWTGEKALICTCFGVAEETIEQSIGQDNLKTVEEVGDRCNAGTGCGSCQPLIQEILDDIFRA